MQLLAPPKNVTPKTFREKKKNEFLLRFCLTKALHQTCYMKWEASWAQASMSAGFCALWSFSKSLIQNYSSNIGKNKLLEKLETGHDITYKILNSHKLDTTLHVSLWLVSLFHVSVLSEFKNVKTFYNLNQLLSEFFACHGEELKTLRILRFHD